MHSRISKLITVTGLMSLLVLTSHSSIAGEAKEALATDSNLIDFSYPGHACNSKPVKPKHPAKRASFNNVDDYNAAVADYNVRVASYNKIIKTYKLCINTYIKNGNHDINVIRKQLNNALKEARAK